MPAPIVLSTLTPETKKVLNPPTGQPVIATKADLRDGSRPIDGGGGTPIPSNDGWQATLESTFMIADSFDDYEDWNPSENDNYAKSGTPIRTNGAPSIWGRYSTTGSSAIAYTNANGLLPTPDGSNAVFSGGATGEFKRGFDDYDGRKFIVYGGMNTPVQVGETVTIGAWSAEVSHVPKAIGSDHPVYRNRGKSLCINYNNFNDGIMGFGPARMTTFFGEAGNSLSGLKKVHVFWMMKFDTAFFRKNLDGTFPQPGVHKLFDICSGHVGLNDWGSDAEKAVASSSDQVQKEYGVNHSIVGSLGGGASTPRRLFLSDSGRRAVWRPTWGTNGLWAVEAYPNGAGFRLAETGTATDGTDIHPPFVADEWFGVEFAFDIGTVDTADGSVEFWMYDSLGNEVGYHGIFNTTRKVHFDHLYNLFTMGGNRICNAYGDCDPDAHSRIYIDDFALDPQRIGPTYFQKLSTFEGGPL